MLSSANDFLRTIYLPSHFILLITFREFWLVPNIIKVYSLLFLRGESTLERNGNQDLRLEMLMRDEKCHCTLHRTEERKSE